MAYVGNTPSRGQWRKLTDISASFDGVTTTFTTSVPPGTSEYYVTAGTASQLIISIGGVIQEPDVDYSVSTYSITFTTAPAAGLSFFGILCGDALNTGVPSDGSITTAKLGGNLTVDLASGTAAAPSLTFDSNTGLFSPAPDEVSISTNGTERLRIDSAGQIEAVSLGTASAPTFSFTGDVNTGIYSPGADQLAISTGGTGRLFIDSSGRVGIGTSSPGGILDIRESNSGGTALAQLVNTSNTASSNARFKIATGGTSAGNPILQFTNDTSNWYINADQSDSFKLKIGTTVSDSKLVVDSSGQVGIGTTSPDAPFKVATSSTSNGVVANFENSSTGALIQYGQPGVANWRAGVVSGADAFAIYGFGSGSYPERLRVDSSGRLLVGTSSAPSIGQGQYSKLVVQAYVGSSTGPGMMTLQRGQAAASIASGDRIGELNFTDSAGATYGMIYCDADAASGTNDYPGRLVFSTTADGASSPTERVRITNTGALHVFNGDVGIRSISSASAGTSVSIFRGSHSGTGNGFLQNGTESIYIWSNGNIQNTNNSYGAISDIKLKENIVDAGSQWNDLKSLQVRKYNFKEETGQQTHTQIGLVAQEVELVSPGLVTESPDRDAEGNDLGTVTKSVNYSVLYMKAVKTLQEAMERIETLETKVAALESA